MQWYLSKSQKKLQKSNIPIMTKSLHRRLLVTQKALNSLTTAPPYVLVKRLEQKVMSVIKIINNMFDLQTKQAPLLRTADAIRIALFLWSDISRTRGTRPTSIPLRKKAATVLVLASLTGSRWIDLHRIHWQDLKFTDTGPTKVMWVNLRMTKNNLCNEVPQRLFWTSSSSTPSYRDPLKWLRRYWIWKGKPSTGFIFGPEDKLFPDETWGNDTISQVQRAAKLLGYPADNIPTKHSARVTMVITLYNLGVDSARINRFLNWKTDRMQTHYINTRDAMALGAPAHRLATLSASELSAVQSNFI